MQQNIEWEKIPSVKYSVSVYFLKSQLIPKTNIIP